MRVGVDIDDVLYPWFGLAHEACIRMGLAAISSPLPSTWSPFDEYGCTADEWYFALAEATVSGRLYGGSPIPGAVLGLQRLRDAGHSVHLVTARGFLAHGELIKAQTVQWISDYAVPHDTLTFAKDKTLVRTDVFADDAEHNLAALARAGVRTCLIDAPHNQHVVHGWRAGTFTDFVEGLLSE